MRLTVLGCEGPYPSANGACSGYLLEAGDVRVLLDCGPGVLSRLTTLCEPAALDAVLLTHMHYDHTSDMLALSYRCDALGCRLPVYLPAQEAPMRGLLRGCRAFDLRDVDAGGGISIGDIRVNALPVRHPLPAFALRFAMPDGRALCYTGDTNTCAGLAPFARDCHLLLSDACFTDELWNASLPHLSAREAGKLAKAANAGRLILTHFRPDIPKETLLCQAREAFPRAVLAYPGLVEMV